MKIISKNKNKGFSLVELVVVVAIIAILVLIAVPAYTRYIDKANKTSELASADLIYGASVTTLFTDYTSSSKVSGLTGGQKLPDKYQTQINKLVDRNTTVYIYSYASDENIGTGEDFNVILPKPTPPSTDWIVYVKRTAAGKIDMNGEIFIAAPEFEPYQRRVYKNGKLTNGSYYTYTP